MALFSISSSSLFLLLFHTVLFAGPATSYPLQNICTQTKDPSLCFRVLGPHSNATLQELDRIMLFTTIANVTRTGAKIQSFMSQTKDSDLKRVYSLCNNNYIDALSSLNVAKQKLLSGDYGEVNAAASTVSRDASSCKQAFALAPHKYVPIGSDNDNVDALSSVLLAVSSVPSGPD